jgi:CheY-like chemotaxis protein
MTGTSTILLVEDNPDDIELIEYAFEKAGIDRPLFVVQDGDAAVEYLGSSHDPAYRLQHPLPRLILLDIKLPKRSGFDVLSFVRHQDRTKHIPVVMLTSSNQPGDIKRAYELGANSYLVKPVRQDALLEMVRSLNMYWITLNQGPYQ